MKEWFTKVFFPAVGENSFLLVESLGTYKDRAEIDQEKPPDKKYDIGVIPPKATDYCQPLDKQVFRMWKAFHNRITNRILIDGIDIVLHQRDNIINLQSLIHSQFSSERLRPFFRYA